MMSVACMCSFPCSRIKLTEENKRELAGDQQDMEEEEEEEENEEEDEVGY
jgi:hypothetical protein